MFLFSTHSTEDEYLFIYLFIVFLFFIYLFSHLLVFSSKFVLFQSCFIDHLKKYIYTVFLLDFPWKNVKTPYILCYIGIY